MRHTVDNSIPYRCCDMEERQPALGWLSRGLPVSVHYLGRWLLTALSFCVSKALLLGMAPSGRHKLVSLLGCGSSCRWCYLEEYPSQAECGGQLSRTEKSVGWWGPV